jgi:hypothetical protein
MDMLSILDLSGVNPIWRSFIFFTMSDNILFNNIENILCAILSSVIGL